jgi:GGDEF domain-containing protein
VSDHPDDDPALARARRRFAEAIAAAQRAGASGRETLLAYAEARLGYEEFLLVLATDAPEPHRMDAARRLAVVRRLRAHFPDGDVVRALRRAGLDPGDLDPDDPAQAALISRIAVENRGADA